MTAERAINLGGITSSDRPAALFARWAAGAMVGLLATVALLMLWRRLASALHTPLDPLSLAMVGLTVVFVAGGARRLWQVTSPVDRVVAILPSLSLLACGAALSLPGTSQAGLAVFWGLVAAEELWVWRNFVRPSTRRKRPSAQQVPQTDLESEAEPTLPPAKAVVSIETLSKLPAEDVLQHLTRSRTAEGVEQLSGWLRMPFVAGQRTANIHVAFCPPFAKTPKLEVEQCDGPTVRIKTAQILPHGARLDLKLAQASETPVAVVLEFAARDSDSR